MEQDRKLSILKKAVVAEQKKSASLQAELDQRDAEVQAASAETAAAVEERERLAFNNERLQKRVQVLQMELEQKDKAAAAKGSWTLGSSMGWVGSSTMSKSEGLKLQEQLAVMEEQLEIKIRENVRALSSCKSTILSHMLDA